MRKNFGPKPYMYPMPVLIIASYDEDGVPDAMNAAWGVICDMDRIAVYISADHKTTANILARRAFTVSMADAAHTLAADYVGIVSANDVPDKFARSGFHAVKSEFVDAPLISELPMALECRLESYDGESECMVGAIVNVCADAGILGADGEIDLSLFHPICYDPVHHAYVTLGEKTGNAFRDGLSLK